MTPNAPWRKIVVGRARDAVGKAGRTLLWVGSFLTLSTAMTDADPADRQRWDRRYDAQAYVLGTEPVAFLAEVAPRLPKGKALDLAAGEGRNAVFLAERGWDVTALDISPVGLDKARRLAEKHHVSITTRVVDLEGFQLPENAYDVIVMTYYLQRDLFPQIARALRPGGMAVIETYTRAHRRYHPEFREAYLLEPDELLGALPGLTILRYQVRDDGHAVRASLLAEKRCSRSGERKSE